LRSKEDGGLAICDIDWLAMQWQGFRIQAFGISIGKKNK